MTTGCPQMWSDARRIANAYAESLRTHCGTSMHGRTDGRTYGRGLSTSIILQSRIARRGADGKWLIRSTSSPRSWTRSTSSPQRQPVTLASAQANELQSAPKFACWSYSGTGSAATGAVPSAGNSCSTSTTSFRGPRAEAIARRTCDPSARSATSAEATTAPTPATPAVSPASRHACRVCTVPLSDTSSMTATSSRSSAEPAGSGHGSRPTRAGAACRCSHAASVGPFSTDPYRTASVILP
jgi:hypothetical protein